MAVYVVTWNLNKEGAAYNAARKRFFELLESFPFKLSTGLDTVAWIDTSLDHEAVYNHLCEAFDKNDRLYIAKVRGDAAQGWLDTGTWEWINSRCPHPRQ